MRNKLKYIKAGMLSLIIMLLVSCLKKDNLPDFTKVDPVIEFPLGGPGLKFNSLSAFSTDIVDTAVAVYLASPDPLDHDVTVNIQADPSIVSDYNTANGTSYISAPSNYYQIENTQVTIRTGYRIGRVKIKIYFNRFDLTKNYMIGLKIADAPGLLISGNFGKFIWAFNVRNPYEGNYRETGQIILYNGATVSSGVAATRTFDRTIAATTINASTVQTNIADLGNYMNLSVDATSNAVTVSPASTNSFTIVENNGPCNYTPGTKTFTLNLRYFNASGNLREVTQAMVKQ